MISAMEPDTENTDENVRSATATAFAAIASALGIDQRPLNFLTAACRSTSVLTRHTGINIVQQIASMMATGIPHFGDLVRLHTTNKTSYNLVTDHTY
jgi:splicing factor 3B subunit 1